ncbi:anthranilate synthase component 2 [Hypnocyclicus thermotrophus]|uniref:Anthranilate synthase component 2 n=1 Tax=Hypnocyclicus thermotrophus TaxID=1627895 RepID=A0AA46DZQ4_9FUSO|nr:aminodeoxychorismate/anthranilate synthase component II [Hypnocyclicus thermotrophus]TDT71870.1 anthranilate synthase component 2 [Hypnocyclicus thermotrophus]
MIILIDNYDSFTYNLYQYLGTFEKNIKVIRNDEMSVEEIKALNPEKIVLSPGPKTPKEAGICVELIQKLHQEIPILGICLGHQSIGEAFGATISYAKAIYHGKSSMIKHDGKGVFKKITNPTQVARYHSLAIIDGTLSNDFEITAKTDDGEIMGIRHKKYKLIGLQFHPESIYTPEGLKMIENFVNL